MLRRLPFLLMPLVVAAACHRDEVDRRSGEAAGNIRGQLTGEGPIGARVTREEIERQRFAAEWQRLRSFQAARQAARQIFQPSAERVKLTFIKPPKFSEKLDQASLQNIDLLPIQVPIRGDVSGPSVLRAQVLLDRLSYSPGVIDGRWGKNTAIAVYWFQRQNGLETTGEIDEATFRTMARLADYPPTVVDHTSSVDDVRGPFMAIPEDVYDQARLDCLCHESLTEKLAEKFHTTSELLALLNPGVDLNGVQANQRILGLNVRAPVPEGVAPDIQRLVVSVEGNYLHALDSAGRLLFHAPTTVGSRYDPSPDETATIVGIAHNPHFHYQPKLFHEVPDTDPEAHLQPGPNSPVGVVWMALSKPHYGIHGTADPESIGYASSHGCIRLTNWDAHDVSHRVGEGTPVAFVDTRGGEAIPARQ